MKNTENVHSLNLSPQNVTIDSLVRFLRSKLKSPRIFDKDHVLTTYDKSFVFFLPAIAQEFDVYTEIDLLLLVYGCKINLILPKCLEYLSFLCPTDQPHSLELLINEEGELSCNHNMLNYNSATKILKKNLKRSIKDYKSSIPKKKEKKNDENDISEPFTNFEGKLTEEYDIDGIRGILVDLETKDVIGCNLILNISKNQIYTKNFYLNEIPIKDYDHIKIGKFNTVLGDISLFIVFSSNTEIDVLLFTCHVEDFMKQRISSNTSSIPAYKLSIFFQTLLALYLNACFFIESYGCKKFFKSDTFNDCYLKLLPIFNLTNLMNLYFDLGTEIRSTTSEAIFLSPTTFQKLRIEPNFRLLFCNIISNYNSNQISIQNDLVFQYGFVEKFNFYSLIEDNFAKIRKIPYLPLRSLKLAENGIENYIYKKNSVKIAYPELEPIKESLTSLSCLGYRFEIRVKGLFIGSGINFYTLCLIPRHLYLFFIQHFFLL
ncbi:hypothetical protein NBO_38g0002 [Nosema bombycis CQ1]|uniref:Uncharacterized protein n=1 Tax=Nosema bombycis (strain CQ1 / CVCC 102059) TaxID=578461 RepID=R0KTF2_NOSB1|nr:hypothetical protein NBO_38g0002 [Nosema bombycis CQ1]|eukprot:EOB14091.1 hypothetical protein NBO_38g0002 [Nosema bombycis CQ1]